MIVLNRRNLTIFCVHFFRRRIHFSRGVLENCATEYSSFRDMEASEREKCYTNCNPQDVNTRDRNVSRQERREIIRCLSRDRCFRLNVYDFVDNAEFQRLRECADSKCPRQLRINERRAQKYRDARDRKATSEPRQPDSKVSTSSQSLDPKDSTPVTTPKVTPGVTDESETPTTSDDQMVSSTAAPDQFINWISLMNAFY